MMEIDMNFKNLTITTLSLVSLTLFTACNDEINMADTNNKKAALGALLFSDTSLSQNQTMSCATCHNLDAAMVDARGQVKPSYNVGTGASLGDDNVSLGDRNAPMAAYAFMSPNFSFDEDEGAYVGGFFLDGRARTLKAQAKAPFLNPLEMNMTNESQVISRIQLNTEYVTTFKEIYGENVFDNTLTAYDALANAIATFEQTAPFKSFDSKYDKFIDGDYALTTQEEEGMALFNGKAKCKECHPINGYHPLMTDYTYDNIGVPTNTELRTANGGSLTAQDKGLGGELNDATLDGAFKVASLRNIAVTAPYMHNGEFKSLETVVHFYNTRDIGGINPETNATWQEAEVPLTVNNVELGNLGLTTSEEAALVAFLKTFTDEKFESLIP